MKVYVLNPMHADGIALLKAKAEVVLWNDPGAEQWVEDADAIIVRRYAVSAEQIAKAKRLRMIAKHGVGVDTLDLAACRARGLVVVNTPFANSQSVAELAIGLAFALGRRIPMSDGDIRRGEAQDRGKYDGWQLHGKSLGVVGLGNIGRRTARMWRAAFEAPVWAYDPYLDDDVFARFGAQRCRSLAEMLPRIDALTIHCPLTPETRGMIGAKEIALMKPSAFLICTARGGIVDEAALAAALQAKKLAGAAMDVFTVEPPPTDHPLLSCRGFVATQHIGGGTAEALREMATSVAEEVLAVLGNQKPRWPLY
ncbi:MAG: hydroxyacid dehydrogenase [Alphaproteobacteria bacterium]|nr:hydroxyacid dehydrogenase [Alphaproteobacteria bacterium]